MQTQVMCAYLLLEQNDNSMVSGQKSSIASATKATGPWISFGQQHLHYKDISQGFQPYLQGIGNRPLTGGDAKGVNARSTQFCSRT